MKVVLRPAIALIELIFALLIMGIVLMSAPMLMNVAAKSSYVAIQQESISEAATHMNLILNFHWDENNADPLYADHLLIVSNGDSELDANSTTNRRFGTPSLTHRTFTRSDGTTGMQASTALGNESGDRDDMDDFKGHAYLINIDPSDSDYVAGASDMKISTDISYIVDSPDAGTSYKNHTLVFNATPTVLTGAQTSNIKYIKVTLTDTSGVAELNKTIILNAFSCNIGSYELESKVY